ncbi:DEAD/DEAH box helicase [Neptunomonas japonica]|uniref:DEAD/DEAH box helicase n=1 Tax=Neptunomonas japonica TaxID=417574 RepID=UPI00040002D1|nr:DEAD/DEAH box helicase [Neptunomonas japonica]
MPAFSELNLCPELLFTLDELGHHTPTPIQAQAIPAILQGHDVMAEAQTGTGKTASFAVPMIEKFGSAPQGTEYHHIKGLILTPTRELAMQVGDHTLAYGRALGVRVISIYGGVRFDNQIRKMKRGTDILVATPGRLLDMLEQKKFSLEQLEVLVLDEADRMLDLGFIHDIQKLLKFIPKNKQTLLFSATFNSNIEALAESLLREPKRISVSTRNSTTSQVKQVAYAVDNQDKSEILSYLIKGGKWTQTLVFTRTKKRADLVTEFLQAEEVSSLAIHGDKLQRERTHALKAFATGEIRVLVATDVAARGIDIESLPRVVNYDLPNQPEAYVHRIGRTGRAGLSGQAISLVAPDERCYLAEIETLINKRIPLQPVPFIENGKIIEGKPLQPKSSKNKGQQKRNSKPKHQYQAPEAEKPTTPALRRSLFKK